MRKPFRIILVIISLLIILGGQPRQARAFSNDGDVSPPLCPPGMQTDWNTDCSPLGPSQYLQEMAEVGISFPLPNLPIIKPDPSLNEIDYKYAFVNNDDKKVPVYNTLQAAAQGNKKGIVRRIGKGFNYVAYTEVGFVNGRPFYHTENGWVASKDITLANIPTFQGVELVKTPERPFGWILTHFVPGERLETKRTPGFSKDDYTGYYRDHLDIVQIYDTKKIGKWNWYMIAPNEWVFQTHISVVTPNTTPPEGNNWTRWIEVNLYEQTIAVYENNELVFATLISSGAAPYYTYPGTFQIFEKLPSTEMRGDFTGDSSDAYYLENVPWTMYFDGSRALHGAYWRPLLGFPQSHGCVNLSVGDSKWLYDWAQMGDWVYVWDPSGETPSE